MKAMWLARLGAGALLVASTALAGCGPECGDGTTEQDGVCVPVCGPGSTPDPTTGQCVPNFDTVCGDHTVYDAASGACLPDYDVLCPAGTIWDNDALECVLPAADVTEGDEPNDATTGGSPTLFGLPAEGETVTLGGSILAPGEDGADYDVFEFEATKGQVLLFEGTTGPHLPSVAFMIGQPDLFTEESPTSLSVVRYGLATTGRNPARTIRVLETGTYWLVVTDKENLVGLGITGGADMTYHVGVTLLATPADVALAVGSTATFELEGSPALLDVTGISAAGAILAITVEDPSTTAANRVLYALDGSDELLGQLSYDFSFFGYFFPIGTVRLKAPSTDLKLFLDYMANLTGDPSYDVTVEEVNVTDLGTANDTTPIASTEHSFASASQIDTYQFTYEAPASGDVLVRIGVDGRTPDFPALIVLYDEDYGYITDGEDALVFSDWTTDATYYLEVMWDGTSFSGPYAYELNVTVTPITNIAEETAAQNDTALTAQDVDLDPLPSLVNGGLAASGDVDYYQFVPAADVTLTLTVSSSALDAVITLFDSSETELDDQDVGFTGDPETITYDMIGGETYFLRVKDYGTHTGSYRLLVQ